MWPYFAVSCRAETNQRRPCSTAIGSSIKVIGTCWNTLLLICSGWPSLVYLSAPEGLWRYLSRVELKALFDPGELPSPQHHPCT